MKRFIYIGSILLILLFSLQAKAQEDRKKELLQQLVKSPADSTRLKILLKLTKVTRYQPQNRLYYVDQLKKEAEKQGNDFYRCTAYLYGIVEAYNTYNAVGVKYWNSLLEPVARENKYYDMLFHSKRCVIDFLQIAGEYEKEESESLVLLKEAEEVGSGLGMVLGYQSLGNAYFASYRDKEAFRAFEKAYQLCTDLGKGSDVEILNSLIMVSERMKDNANWLKYVKLEEECVRKRMLNSARNPVMQSTIFMMYIHHVAYFVKVGDLEQAGQYYQLAKNSYYAAGESGMYKEYFMRVSCAYFHQLKQFDKALMFSDTLLDLLRPVSELSYSQALAVHADILFSIGRNKEALSHFKMAKAGRDSSQLQILNNQTEQVKNIHNVYLLELEQEQSRQYLQLTILAFLILSILIILGFILYMYRIRRKLMQDETEIRLMTREVEQANQAKERFLSNISTSISKPLDVVVESSLLLASDQEIADEQRVAISDGINKTSADLMQLINNILDLSRLEAGMMRFIVSEVEVFSLIHDVATRASMEQGRNVTIDCPQSALFWSTIDGTRLLNVFHNLFVSILPGKELRVSIEVTADGGELMIRVYETSLASIDLSQDLIIRSEINRMIIHHFEGVYENRLEAPIPYIYFTIKGNFTPVPE